MQVYPTNMHCVLIWCVSWSCVGKRNGFESRLWHFCRENNKSPLPPVSTHHLSRHWWCFRRPLDVGKAFSSANFDALIVSQTRVQLFFLLYRRMLQMSFNATLHEAKVKLKCINLTSVATNLALHSNDVVGLWQRACAVHCGSRTSATVHHSIESNSFFTQILMCKHQTQCMFWCDWTGLCCLGLGC